MSHVSIGIQNAEFIFLFTLILQRVITMVNNVCLCARARAHVFETICSKNKTLSIVTSIIKKK